MFGNIEDRTKLALVAPLHTDRADIKMLSIDSYITTDNMLQNRRGITTYTGTFENIIVMTFWFQTFVHILKKYGYPIEMVDVHQTFLCSE